MVEAHRSEEIDLTPMYGRRSAGNGVRLRGSRREMALTLVRRPPTSLEALLSLPPNFSSRKQGIWLAVAGQVRKEYRGQARTPSRGRRGPLRVVRAPAMQW